MKLTLEPTGDLVNIDGCPARIWEGTDDEQRPVVAYIARVRVEHLAQEEPGYPPGVLPTAEPLIVAIDHVSVEVSDDLADRPLYEWPRGLARALDMADRVVTESGRVLKDRLASQDPKGSP
jgi:hypothetical protein